MKTKLLLVLAAALSLGGVSSSFAQATASTAAPSFKVTPSLVSDYIFRGVRLGGLSFQPSVEMTSGPLTAGIWANAPIDDRIPGQSDPEFDLYGSYTIALNSNISVAPGLTAYTYPKAKRGNGFYTYTVEPNVAVNFTIDNITITPKYYYDLNLEGHTIEVTGAVSIPLKSWGTELAFSGTVGNYKWKNAVENAVPEVRNGGDYWQAGVSLPFAVTPTSKLTIGYAYTQGSSNYFQSLGSPRTKNPNASGNDVYSASWSISF